MCVQLADVPCRGLRREPRMGGNRLWRWACFWPRISFSHHQARAHRNLFGTTLFEAVEQLRAVDLSACQTCLSNCSKVLYTCVVTSGVRGNGWEEGVRRAEKASYLRTGPVELPEALPPSHAAGATFPSSGLTPAETTHPYSYCLRLEAACLYKPSSD